MKLHCFKNDLKEACLLSEKITSKNNTLPILNTLLFSSEKSKLKVSSTNLEVGFEMWIPARVEKEGRVAIPARVISNFINAFPEDHITLEAEKENLRISSEHVSSLLKGCINDDFPRFPVLKNKQLFRIPVSTLRSGLLSVYFSTASSDIKPEISSVCVFINKKTPLTFVATDSFRLSCKEFNEEFGETTSFLIPSKSVVELLRVIETKDGDIEVYIDQNQILFTHNKFHFTSRLTNGVFPDYKQIVPKKFSTEVIISRATLINVLRTAGVFSGRLFSVGVKIYSSDHIIEVQTAEGNTGEHNARIPASVHGEDVQLSFNNRYLLDALAHTPEENIRMGFNGDGKPIFIQGEKDRSLFHLVMPMKNT